MNTVHIHVQFPVAGGYVEVDQDFSMELIMKAAKNGDAASFIVQDLLRAAVVAAPCSDQSKFIP